MCSITGGGERLHTALRLIGSKHRCPWQQTAPLTYNGEIGVSTAFDPILFILTDNEDMHEISNEFDLRADQTTDYRVSALERLKNFP